MTAQDIERVAVVGTGVIGASWVSAFLAAGLDVVATDPAPDADARTRQLVVEHWPVLERIGLADGAASERVTFVDSAAEAVERADFVQESGPEREQWKVEVIAALDRDARPEVVIASSSSGLLPTTLQSACRHHPERVLVGHPFHPAHLVPLVEVVPGRLTSERAVEAALGLYSRVGKRPIRARAELPGHITNRLQAALWREAYWLIQQGAVSVADLDTAISDGPGLRWALLGPLATQSLSGGSGGLAHVLEHLGPPMVEWWRTFETPELDAELTAALIEGVDDELAGLDRAAMERERDALLERLITSKARATSLPGRRSGHR